jgi:hypothetical protein
MAASFLRHERHKFRDACVATGLAVFCIAPLAPAGLLSLLEGARNYDWALYRADQVLGLDSRTFAAWCYSTPWAKQVLEQVYLALPLVMALAWLWSGRPDLMVRVVLWSALAAFLIFALIPAAGPSHVFVGYPWAAPEPSRYVLPPMTPRNAMPSMHLGWSLLILANSRGRWLRSALFLFAVLTGFATVGGGEHYFIDLIAAIPFCAIIQVAVERWRREAKPTTTPD